MRWFSALSAVWAIMIVPIVLGRDPVPGESRVLFDRGRPVTLQGNLVRPHAAAAMVPVTLTSGARRWLTRDVIVRTETFVRPDSWKSAVPPGYPMAPLGTRGEFWVVTTPSVGAALDLAAQLRAHPAIRHAETAMAREYTTDFVPDDSLFNQQWHLVAASNDVDSPEIRVSKVWDSFRGNGVLVGQVDSGCEITHPDLADNIFKEACLDVFDGDTNPAPEDRVTDFHGTSVAGLIAGRGNNGLGIAGVAFESRLVVIRALGGPVSDIQLSRALSHRNVDLAVKNNSWGGPTRDDLDYLGDLMAASIDEAAEAGRGGRGTIMVFSAGNHGHRDDNAGYSGMRNRPEVIPVGAVNSDGTPTFYTTPGASVLISAPGGSPDGEGIVTADNTDDLGANASNVPDELEDRSYSKRFAGTSASAPLITGVVALMIQANPQLGWRDVQDILIRTARRQSLDSRDWQTNGAGIAFHQRLGAGIVDAEAAVAAALNRNLFGTQRRIRRELRDLDVGVTNGNPSGALISFDILDASVRVEHVLLTADIQHPHRGQLRISLISPSGMVSVLADKHPDTNLDYQGWTFLSRRHWGELSRGVWTVRIENLDADSPGSVRALGFELLGSQADPVVHAGIRMLEASGISNRDGAAQPGEIIGESIVLCPSHPGASARVQARIQSDSPGVIIVNESVDAMVRAPDEKEFELEGLQYRLPADAVCGSEIRLNISGTVDGKAFSEILVRKVGERPALTPVPRTVEVPHLPARVPDLGNTNVMIPVALTNSPVIDSVVVRLRMKHSAVGDSRTILVHPDGTEVQLVMNRGGNNEDLGVGECGQADPGWFTLDDAATQLLRGKRAPLLGAFRPEEPLAALRGKPANGEWKLRMLDVYDEDFGDLLCAELELRVRELESKCLVFVPTAGKLRWVAADATGVELDVEASEGPGWRVESSRDLMAWSPSGEPFSVSTTPKRIRVETPPGESARFFRLTRLP